MAHRGDHLFILLRDPQRSNSELLVAPISDPTKTTVSFLQPLLRLCEAIAEAHKAESCFFCSTVSQHAALQIAPRIPRQSQYGSAAGDTGLRLLPSSIFFMEAF